MKIGGIKISSIPALALSPMAGYTNAVFRELMAKSGADITCSELASASALARGRQGEASKTASIIASPKHGISGVQLFGSNAQEFKRAVKYACSKIETGELRAKFIDINLGCPARKITRSGSGSQLLKNSKSLRSIASAATKYSCVPVTAKLRLLPSISASIKIAKLLQGENIAALAFHGRTQEQKYRGKSSWGALAKIKESLSIPMFANGDVKSPRDVKKIIEITGCDAVMIGRAALSNPFVFSQTRQFYKTGSYEKEDLASKAKFFKRYCALSKKYGAPTVYPKELAMRLCSGFPGAARIRMAISKAQKIGEVLAAFPPTSQPG